MVANFVKFPVEIYIIYVHAALIIVPIKMRCIVCVHNLYTHVHILSGVYVLISVEH